MFADLFKTKQKLKSCLRAGRGARKGHLLGDLSLVRSWKNQPFSLVGRVYQQQRIQLWPREKGCTKEGIGRRFLGVLLWGPLDNKDYYCRDKRDS